MAIRPVVSLAAACGLAVSLGLVPHARAQETDPRIDASTGRDVAIYPPDRLFDYRHMLLVIDIPTMSEPKFNATETLTVWPVGANRSEMKLRAGPGLSFNHITVNGTNIDGFSHKDDILRIPFPTAYKPGERVTVVIDYAGDKAGGGGVGLTWSKDDPRTPEEDFLFHSQGQPESNHLWFPCHDFPNERLTTELVVTAPKGYEVVSNGHIVELTRHTNGRTTFHWLQDLPHTTYLVMMAVGKFDIVNVAGKMKPVVSIASAPDANSKEGDRFTLRTTGMEVVGHDPIRPNLWMPVYGPVGSGEAIRDIFANTPEMVAYFEKLFDEPYPWDKYAQILVRDFAAGAMENTSATTFHPQFARGRRGTADGVISHELCHQWFGDLATYKSWQHLWLGEGWATMGEALWAEHQRGENGYQQAIMGDFVRERASRGTFPRGSGMVSNRYGDPQTRFMSSDNVYSKGGFILNMLRARLGDDAFFKGSALYLDRYHLACTETDDFRKCLEATSGQSLERFFDQWVRRPGHPAIDVDLAWDESNSTLTVKAAQTQTINADNPAYAFTLPIYVDLGDDKKSQYVYLDMDGKTAQGTFKLDKKPADVSIDPYLTLLVTSKIAQPLAAWLRILEHGPTLAARVQAADALADFSDPQAVAALNTVATNPDDTELLREVAGDSLAAIGARALGNSVARMLASLPVIQGSVHMQPGASR